MFPCCGKFSAMEQQDPHRLVGEQQETWVLLALRYGQALCS
jgi:hypothetical protein